jgi:hypothetical protein
MKPIDPSVLSILFLIVLVLNLSPLTSSDLAVIPSLAPEAVNVYAQSNQKENVTLTLSFIRWREMGSSSGRCQRGVTEKTSGQSH